jgi:murein DD-endopeptidase MepM/ murein hydrolase activator NlpD
VSNEPSPNTEGEKPVVRKDWLSTLAWVVAAVTVIVAVVVVLQTFGVIPTFAEAPTTGDQSANVSLPTYQSSSSSTALTRSVNPQTSKADLGSMEVTKYTVQEGDSLFSIASDHKLKPDSLLWANSAALNGNLESLSIGQVLNIPPVDGVYYKWQAGDTLQSVADKYLVDPSVILEWPGNHLDLTDPQVEPGQYVMIPGGTGQYTDWVVSVPFTPHSGASHISTQCTIPTTYTQGTGSFIWPSAAHYLSGNDYGPSHLGIDIAGDLGDAVWASDSGVVIWAGSMSGGYGNVIIIEHDTYAHTYDTVYAHLSAVLVKCGQSVAQGQSIGQIGSTGNSTGPHLHFEVREDGGFLNPHYVLP